MRIAFVFLALLCSGCASAPSIFKDGPISNIGTQETSIDHAVTFIDLKSDQSHNLITHLEISSDTIVLIGLGPLGGTLFECKQTQLEKSCDSIHKAIPAEIFFDDMQLIFWSAETLQRNLNAEFSLDDNGLNRRLYKQNKLIAHVEYSEKSRWDADVVYTHEIHKYRMKIHPLNAQHNEGK